MSKREDVGYFLMVVFQAPENEKVSTKALIGMYCQTFLQTAAMMRLGFGEPRD